MSTQHKLDEAFERIKLLEAEVETVIEEMDALNEKMKAQEVYWKTIDTEVKEGPDEADLQPLDEEMQPE